MVKYRTENRKIFHIKIISALRANFDRGKFLKFVLTNLPENVSAKSVSARAFAIAIPAQGENGK